MKENNREYKACLIPIAAFVVAGLIGKFLFWIIEEYSTYLAAIIMVAIFIPFLIFIIRCIIGMKK